VRRATPSDAPYFVQHLGGLGADAFAVTGGEDDADARDVVLDWRIELGEQVAAGSSFMWVSLWLGSKSDGLAVAGQIEVCA
jgi:hypothetical protein